MSAGIQALLAEVQAERARQDIVWGEQNHPDGTGVAAYEGADQRARIARASCQAAAAQQHVTWRHILTEEVAEAFAEDDPAKLREELIQIAAVAVQWAQAIDRRAR